jgi:signal transduction histidine kinase
LLKHRGASALLGSTVVVAILVGGAIHAANRERARREFQERQLHTADIFAAVLRSELTGTVRTLRAVAAGIDARPTDRSIRDQLNQQTHCTEGPCFTALGLYDENGRLLHATARPPDLDAVQVQSSIDWRREPSRARSVRTLVPSSRVPAIVIVVPAEHGILAAQLDFESLFAGRAGERTSEWHAYPTVVIDDRGNIVFHSRQSSMRMNNVAARTATCNSCHASLRHIDQMIAARHGAIRYELDGAPQLAAVAPFAFEGGPWIAAVMSPAEEADGVLAAEARQLGLLAFVSMAILGVGIYRTSQSHSNEALRMLNVKLAAAAAEWRTTVDTIDAAVVVLDPAGAIERMNRGAAATVPGPLWSWTGRPSDALRPHAPWDSALDLARAAVATGTTQARRVTGPDARTWELWCRTHDNAMHASVVVVARDVTSVVTLQESLRRAETMAALGSVVAGVAHEVRNPLFAISSMVDALSLRKDAELTPFLDALHNEVVRLSTLMNELLEYGTPTAVTLQPRAIGEVVDEALRSCAAQAGERGVELVRSGADATVWMDDRRLMRVFINVIQNAIQHAPPQSEVAVTVADDRDVVVAVRDRGPGFTDKDLPRVFTPFFSRRAGGFGLGLAICERIVGEHRGRIHATNHPDGGAVVTITLPLGAPADAQYAAEGGLPC